MSKVDILVTRHGKKAQRPAKDVPGGLADRTDVALSEDGMCEAESAGRTEFSRESYSGIVVVTSDFLRTNQTADAVLRGAGIDLEEVASRGMRYRRGTDSRMGLSGSHWTVPGPKFGPTQDELDGYVRNILREHSLLREGDEGNESRHPVMAARGASIYEALAGGLYELGQQLRHDERGLLLVVTHASIVDAFATAFTGDLTFEDTLARTESGKQIYAVSLPDISAHNEGAYIRGSAEIRDRQPLTGSIELAVKGRNVSAGIVNMAQDGQTLAYRSRNGVQRVASR